MKNGAKKKPLNEEKLAKLKRVMAHLKNQDTNVEDACAKENVHNTTYYNWLRSARANKQLTAAPSTQITIHNMNPAAKPYETKRKYRKSFTPRHADQEIQVYAFKVPLGVVLGGFGS